MVREEMYSCKPGFQGLVGKELHLTEVAELGTARTPVMVILTVRDVQTIFIQKDCLVLFT